MQLTVRRSLLVAVLGAAIFSIFGWATAVYKTPKCKIAFVEDLNARGVTASLAKHVPINSMDVSARALPFVVDVELVAPGRASSHSARYLALPWGVVQISSKNTDKELSSVGA